tara:strand:- start:4227 stop:5162 length:936 start_codon:yes stop_codon:yes gene_type:complete
MTKEKIYSLPVETWLGDWEGWPEEIAVTHPNLKLVHLKDTDDISEGLLIGSMEDLWEYESKHMNQINKNNPAIRNNFEKQLSIYEVDAAETPVEVQTMTIKLTKMERQNTYNATSKILLDGVSIGELKTAYGYTPEGKLRVKSYDVIFRAELPCGKVFQSSNFFEVDGRWETKGSRGGFLQGPRCYLAEYDTYSTEYKTAKEAKAAAMAYIKNSVDSAEEEEAAEEAVEAVEAAETPVEVQTMNTTTKQHLITIYTITIVNQACGWLGKIETHTNKKQAENRLERLTQIWNDNNYLIEMHITNVETPEAKQ